MKKVTIIGVGGIGSWIAEFLTRAGYGVHIIDGDKVEKKNLKYANYTSDDEDKYKVNALHERLLCTGNNGHTTISNEFVEKVTRNASDLVILCVDSIMTRIKLISSLYRFKKLKWIDCRAEGRNFMIFTQKSKLTEEFLASKRTVRASCQRNINEIEAGNLRCAAMATQIALDMLRGKQYPSEVIEVDSI